MINKETSGVKLKPQYNIKKHGLLFCKRPKATLNIYMIISSDSINMSMPKTFSDLDFPKKKKTPTLKGTGPKDVTYRQWECYLKKPLWQ